MEALLAILALAGAAVVPLINGMLQRKKVSNEAEKAKIEADSILAEGAKVLVEPLIARITKLEEEIAKVREDMRAIELGVTILTAQVKSAGLVPEWEWKPYERKGI